MKTSGFTHGLTGERIPAWRPLTAAERGIPAAGSADAPALFPAINRYGRSQDPSSNTARLRRALIDGPKTAHELGELAGLPAENVGGLLNKDVEHGRVSIDRTSRPYRFALSGGLA